MASDLWQLSAASKMALQGSCASLNYCTYSFNERFANKISAMEIIARPVNTSVGPLFLQTLSTLRPLLFGQTSGGLRVQAQHGREALRLPVCLRGYYAHMYIHIYTYIYLYSTDICVCIYIHIHVCMYVCMDR